MSPFCNWCLYFIEYGQLLVEPAESGSHELGQPQAESAARQCEWGQYGYIELSGPADPFA
jgi:hypothetical protein